MGFAKREQTNLTSFEDSALSIVTIWTVDIICLVVLTIMLSITGIIGNTPTLIVFVKRKDKHASNTFIKMLAVLDLLVCTFVMPFTICYELHVVTSDVACRLLEYLRHFTVFASNAALVTIATERYIAVCKIGLKLTIKMVNRGIGLIIVTSVFVAMPAVGVFAAVGKDAISNLSCSFPHENAPQEFCHFTYTIIGVEAVTIYQIFQAVMFVIVLIVIIVLYSSVYMVLWKQSKFRKQISERQSKFQSSFEESHVDNAEVPTPSEIKPSVDKREVILTTCITAENNFKQNRNSFPSLHSGKLQNAIRRRSNSEPYCQQRSHKNCNVEKPIKTSVAVVSTCKKKNERLCHNGQQIKTSEPAIFAPRKKIQRGNFKETGINYYHTRTAKMLFLCTLIYFVTWIPFWLDIFGITNSRTFRYMFFIAHVSNPIIYGIVNKKVRAEIKALLLMKCFRNSRILPI